jgi:hypothetical protein
LIHRIQLEDRGKVRVAVRVDSSGIRGGLGVGVVGSEMNWGRCAEAEVTEAAISLLDGGFGENCSTAIRAVSGSGMGLVLA